MTNKKHLIFFLLKIECSSLRVEKVVLSCLVPDERHTKEFYKSIMPASLQSGSNARDAENVLSGLTLLCFRPGELGQSIAQLRLLVRIQVMLLLQVMLVLQLLQVRLQVMQNRKWIFFPAPS